MSQPPPLTPPTPPGSRDVIRVWHRRHGNGWQSIVRQHRDGTFTRTGGVPPGFDVGDTEYVDPRSLVAAKAGADAEVARAGHVCDGACEPWQEARRPV